MQQRDRDKSDTGSLSNVLEQFGEVVASIFGLFCRREAGNASGLLKMKCTIAPLFRSNIANGFGKVPTMPVKVLRIVLAFAIRLVFRFGQNNCPVLSSPLTVTNSIFNANLNDMGIVGRNISFGYGEAAVAGLHLYTVIGDAQADREAESLSEPIRCDSGIWVNQHGYHGTRGHGAVGSHFRTLPFEPEAVGGTCSLHVKVFLSECGANSNTRLRGRS